MADILNYKKLTDIENLHENPFGTKEGQLVVSSSENFWARLSRLGRVRNVFWDGVNLPSGQTGYPSAVQTSPGHIFFPKRAVISATVDCIVMIQINTNVAAGNALLEEAFLKAGTPLVLNFDGDVICFAGGQISAMVKGSTADGKIYGSISGVEVAEYV